MRFGQRGDTFHVLLAGKLSVWIPCLKNQTLEIAKSFSSLIDNFTDLYNFKQICFSFNEADNGFYTVDKLIDKYPVLRAL